MLEKEESKTGLTRKSLIIGTIAAVLSLAFANSSKALWQSDYYNLWNYGGMASHDAWTGPFILSTVVFTGFVLAAINRIRPILSKQEVTIILLMVMLPSYVGFSYYTKPVLNLIPGITCRMLPQAQWAQAFALMPDVFGPKDPEFWSWVDKPNAIGEVNWGPLIIPMSFAAFMVAVMGLTSIFVSLVFQRIWIDVEGVQFPDIELMAETVDATQPNAPIWKNKYFIVAFLIQFIWWGAATLPTQFPGNITMDITQWRFKDLGGTLFGFRILPIFPNQYTATTALPWVPIEMHLNPWNIGWGMILSLETLIGILIGWFVFWFAWPLAMSSLGYMPAYTTGVKLHGSFTIFYSTARRTPTLTGFQMGMFIGVGVITIWLNRHTLAQIARGIYKEPDAAVDPERPIAYRLVWIGIIVFFILTVLCAYIMKISWEIFTVGMTLDLLMTIAFWRVIAETGGVFGGLYNWDIWSYTYTGPIMAWTTYTFPQVMLAGDQVNQITYVYLLHWSAPNQFYWWWHSSGLASLRSLKLSSLTHTKKRDTFKAVILAVVIISVGGVLLNYLIAAWLPITSTGSIYSLWRWFGGRYFVDSYTSAKGKLYVYTWGARMNWDTYTDLWIKIAIGAVAIIGTALLRMHFSWLQVSTAGLALGTYIGYFLWAPFLIAFIVKYLVLKTMGTQAYMEKLKPIAIGFIFGYMMIYIITVLVDLPFWWNLAWRQMTI